MNVGQAEAGPMQLRSAPTISNLHHSSRELSRWYGDHAFARGAKGRETVIGIANDTRELCVVDMKFSLNPPAPSHSALMDVR
jgi:hypothetical protein